MAIGRLVAVSHIRTDLCIVEEVLSLIQLAFFRSYMDELQNVFHISLFITGIYIPPTTNTSIYILHSQNSPCPQGANNLRFASYMHTYTGNN